MAFAGTTWVLSLFNCGARGVSHPELVVALCVATGGMAQFMAGVWEFAVGNTFGAAVFVRTVHPLSLLIPPCSTLTQALRVCSISSPDMASHLPVHVYVQQADAPTLAHPNMILTWPTLPADGSFWWSYACIYIPWFGIQAAVPADELPNAIGVYLSAWVIITFIFLCSCLRSSVALVSTVFFLWLTFVLLMAAEMSGNSHVQTAGGAIGIVTAVCAFYTAACGLCDGTTSLFKLPTGDLTRSD